MIPRVPAEVRGHIIELRSQRMTFAEIGRQVGIHEHTVSRICEDHFGNLVERARDALRREINLARAERFTAPPFHPEDWR